MTHFFAGRYHVSVQLNKVGRFSRYSHKESPFWLSFWPIIYDQTNLLGDRIKSCYMHQKPRYVHSDRLARPSRVWPRLHTIFLALGHILDL